MPENQGKQRGRPRKNSPKTVAIVVKVSQEFRESLHHAAGTAGLKLSEYCRDSLERTVSAPKPESVDSRLQRIESRLTALERCDQDTIRMESSERE